LTTTPPAPGARTPVDTRLLSIYLSDHLAGAVAGLELAKRSRSNNEGNDLGRFLDEEIIPEISEDRRSLEDVMQRLGIHPSAPKNALGWAGEKIGRLKLNGSVRSYSPLSRTVELEGLVMGVRGKMSAWDNLRASVADDPRLEGVDWDELIRRAESQIERLRPRKLEAAKTAFSTPSKA
jgi:hypothetical protein